jgi:hypothetical protein
MEKNEMGGSCSAYGGKFWWGNVTERDYVENLGVDWRIILKWIFKNWNGGMNWIDLAQNRDRWRVPVNAVMNFRAP